MQTTHGVWAADQPHGVWALCCQWSGLMFAGRTVFIATLCRQAYMTQASTHSSPSLSAMVHIHPGALIYSTLHADRRLAPPSIRDCGAADCLTTAHRSAGSREVAKQCSNQAGYGGNSQARTREMMWHWHWAVVTDMPTTDRLYRSTPGLPAAVSSSTHLQDRISPSRQLCMPGPMHAMYRHERDAPCQLQSADRPSLCAVTTMPSKQQHLSAV
jgi:hypothetical protein